MGKYLEDRELDSVLESYFEEGFNDKIDKEEIFKNANIIRDKAAQIIKDKKYKYITVIRRDNFYIRTGFKFKNIYLIDFIRFKKDKYCKDRAEAEGIPALYRSISVHNDGEKYFDDVKDEILKAIKSMPEFKIFENKLIHSVSPNTSHGYDSFNYELCIKKSKVSN